MLTDYKDITSRIAEPPKWYDSKGTPRYDKFDPKDVPNIYACEAVLYRIDCQACDAHFDVAEQTADLLYRLDDPDAPDLRESVERGVLHYGDPPNHSCVGDTMNCVDRYVIEYWQQEKHDWVKVDAFSGLRLDADEEGYD